MDQLEVLHVENKQKSEGGYAFYVAGFIIVVFVGLTKCWRKK